MKKKKKLNLKNTDDKCFHNALNVALKYEEIKWNPEIVPNIEPFINKHQWKRINYLSKIDNCKAFK